MWRCVWSAIVLRCIVHVKVTSTTLPETKVFKQNITTLRWDVQLFFTLPLSGFNIVASLCNPKPLQGKSASAMRVTWNTHRHIWADWRTKNAQSFCMCSYQTVFLILLHEVAEYLNTLCKFGACLLPSQAYRACMILNSPKFFGTNSLNSSDAIFFKRIIYWVSVRTAIWFWYYVHIGSYLRKFPN